MSAIELIDISKKFAETTVVSNVDLRVEQGELVSLLGPSGSGKSTILSMIAGLEAPTGGRVMIGGKDVTDVPPSRRNLGVVFQSYALFPHMTVRENVAFPLSIRGMRKSSIEEQVQRALKMVRLEGLADRKQHQLSGGQQQRVALARALVFQPDILLLDEPLGALDKKLREEVQIELRQLQRELGVTTIMVTHDQEEALSLSSRIVVLDGGRIQQIATPELAYRRPTNKFVAEFVGTANLLPGEVSSSNGQQEFRLDSGQRVPVTQAHGPASGAMHLLLRPEHLEILDPRHEHGLTALVTGLVYVGQSLRVHMKTEAGLPLLAFVPGTTRAVSEGQQVKVSWAPEDSWLVPA